MALLSQLRSSIKRTNRKSLLASADHQSGTDSLHSPSGACQTDPAVGVELPWIRDLTTPVRRTRSYRWFPFKLGEGQTIASHRSTADKSSVFLIFPPGSSASLFSFFFLSNSSSNTKMWRTSLTAKMSFAFCSFAAAADGRQKTIYLSEGTDAIGLFSCCRWSLLHFSRRFLRPRLDEAPGIFLKKNWVRVQTIILKACPISSRIPSSIAHV